MTETLIIKNHSTEGPGTFGEFIASRAIQHRVIEPEAIESSTLDGVGHLVVLGGPMGVYEAAQHPTLRTGMRLMEQALAKNIPVLGICLGAQMAAHVLGSRVYKGEAGEEAGWMDVFLTKAGMIDPLMHAFSEDDGEFAISVFHWHGDTFDLPKGADLLATSAMYQNQAFRHGRLYALQFHPEMDQALVDSWTKGHPRGSIIAWQSADWKLAAYREQAMRLYDMFYRITLN